jgi:hypothetical protein
MTNETNPDWAGGLIALIDAVPSEVGDFRKI